MGTVDYTTNCNKHCTVMAYNSQLLDCIFRTIHIDKLLNITFSNYIINNCYSGFNTIAHEPITVHQDPLKVFMRQPGSLYSFADSDSMVFCVSPKRGFFQAVDVYFTWSSIYNDIYTVQHSGLCEENLCNLRVVNYWYMP